MVDCGDTGPLLQTSESFYIASIKQTMSNPRVFPETRRSNPNISTLRINAVPSAFTPQWLIFRDHRDESMVAGLSAIGGLGSLFSTLLVILVGTSLTGAVIRRFNLLTSSNTRLLIASFTGIKPFSPFGLLHNIQQTRMVEECDKLYPALRREIEEQKDNPGVIAYILDTLIDMKTLGYNAHVLPAPLNSSSGASIIVYVRDEENLAGVDVQNGEGADEADTGTSHATRDAIVESGNAPR